MNPLQDGYLGFSFFISSSSKFLIFFNVDKIYSFSNFKKPDDMLCKPVSAIHIKNKDDTSIFHTQMIKNDKNHRSKFRNVFFGCSKLLTDMKIPPFDLA